ncbi:MAG: methionine--tRNA ligase, partial [Candidatus Limnocylindria bacterium]
MPDRYYLTTAIFYPSAGPALHSLFEAIGADAIARYQRLLGKDVRFLTGMDEHSANLERQARDRGVEPRDLVDEWATSWRTGFDRFQISYDRFIRTTDPDHARASTEMVRRALASGDIYKGTYAGWFCVGDNEFKTDSQIVNGRCPDHPTLELQWLEEENYFFRLSRYQAALEQLYREHPSFCEPVHFRNEVLGWLNDGVTDFSISRAGGTWGIPFPDDPSHRIYVWFDALTNYLTGAGFPDDVGSFERWWPADLHVIGKNITRFHCLYWPAMLMSAGLPLPRQVFGHGFMTLNGQRMSKSLGTIVDPIEAAERHGTDPL